MKKIFYLLTALLVCLGARAQVTTSPTPLQEDSENVEIYFHADQGSKGLMGLPASASVYAHTGVEVVNSNGKTESWKYAPTWGQNLEKYKLTYVSPNLWKLTIGDIRKYYGVSAYETVKRLCFVFRNADCSKEGKGPGSSDIFVDVVDKGFQLSFTHSGDSDLIDVTDAGVSFVAATTLAADITISVNGTQIASAKGVKELMKSHDFSTPGEYKVSCVAVSGTETQTRDICLLSLGNAREAADKTLPAPGLTRNSDGSFTFCLPAPQKRNCVVIGSWNDFKPSASGVCEYVDRKIDGVNFRYFKTTVPASEVKGPFSYYYCVDLTRNVGDPYARLVLDPYNDKYISATAYPDMPAYPQGKVPSNTFLAYYADDMLKYDWTCTDFVNPDKENLVIYELLFRDFTGTEGRADGNGTVKGAIEKIPYLKSLGINAVELLPINEFNGNISWGYNPNFYMAPDKAYGTPADYKRFIDECHRQGIAVILDVVFNQSDGCHPWYQLYEPGSNPFYNLDAPHAYSVLNDWNQGYPLVQEQWRDMLQFWLREYKVDGFRFDLVKGLGDNDSYANSGDNATNAFNRSRIDRMKKLHEYVSEVRPDAYFINENLAGAEEENEMAKDGELNWANYNYAGCQYAKGLAVNSNLEGMNAAKGGRTAGSTVAYLESHDEERLAYSQIKDGTDEVRNSHTVAMQRLGCAAAQMILEPGSHMIWQFSEMGNAQSTKNGYGNNTDPKTVDWNLLKDPDNEGLMKTYSQLIRLRLSEECEGLFSTAIQPFGNNLAGWQSGRTIISRAGDKELYCVINPFVSGRPLTVGVDFGKSEQTDYHIVCKSYGSEPEFSVADKTVTVPANCFVVIATRGITGVGNAVTENAGLQVMPGRGSVTVLGAEGRTYVYGLEGIEAGHVDGEGTLRVPAGVYVVRCGSSVKRVIVR